jgi:hypothetical protein
MVKYGASLSIIFGGPRAGGYRCRLAMVDHLDGLQAFLRFPSQPKCWVPKSQSSREIYLTGHPTVDCPRVATMRSLVAPTKIRPWLLAIQWSERIPKVVRQSRTAAMVTMWYGLDLFKNAATPINCFDYIRMDLTTSRNYGDTQLRWTSPCEYVAS